jgi:hypothetical protein
VIKKVILIRLLQLYRILKGVGILRTILIVFFFIFLCVFLFANQILKNNPGEAAFITALLVLMIHLNRSDKLFLRINFINYKIIYFIEYLLLTFPVLFLLLIHNFLFLPLLIVAISGIVFIEYKSSRSSLHSKIPSIIPSSCFEWKAGLRQTFLLLLLLWIAGLGLSFILWSVPIIILITGIITTGFYEKQESLQMILAYEKGAGSFLAHKISLQFKLYTIYVLPLVFAFIIFHPAQWYIPVSIYIIILFLQAYQVFNKYAFYNPHSRQTASQVFMAIGVLGAIIPVFLPVIWLLTVLFYFRSKEKLNIYLDDFN